LLDPAQEAREIAALIAVYRGRDARQSIAVLVRQRQHAVHVSRALRAHGIRFQAIELEPLIDQPVVRDLLALSRALLHLGDRTAWLAVLRSPVCGLTLADLESLTRSQGERTCWELLHDAPLVRTLSADGQARIRAILAVLDRSIARTGRMPLRAWVESTWLGLGGPATTEERRALEDASTFFERLSELEDAATLPAGQRFDAEFADLYARPDPMAPPQLQIMTIHKAKGLEFDIVILPGLGRGRVPSNPPLLRWLEVARAEGDRGLLLAPIERRGSGGDPLFDYLFEKRNGSLRARAPPVRGCTRERNAASFGHVQPGQRKIDPRPTRVTIDACPAVADSPGRIRARICATRNGFRRDGSGQ
jgi:superfamily I DNA/RNA helicase